MILGFKTKFPNGKPTKFPLKIKRKTKIHTIRQDKNSRWESGRKIQMATGVRTKKYKCFYKKYSCVNTQEIRIIHFHNKAIVLIDGKQLHITEIKHLAHNDGFDSVDDFFDWFREDFIGKIIHWTDFKY